VAKEASIILADRVEKMIYLVRGQKVMLDEELAQLYGVDTRALNRAVRRNGKRFPVDFAFLLTRQEVTSLKYQIGTSSWGGRRKLPMVFTEQGVAMLSSVLNSERAVRVNIEIVRTFVRLRQLLSSHADLARKLEELEKKYDAQFRVVFDAIRQLMAPPPATRKSIGFHVRERPARYGTRRART
jgi:hypothetical protein